MARNKPETPDLEVAEYLLAWFRFEGWDQVVRFHDGTKLGGLWSSLSTAARAQITGLRSRGDHRPKRRQWLEERGYTVPEPDADAA